MMNKRDKIATVNQLVKRVRPHMDKIRLWFDGDVSSINKDKLTNFNTLPKRPPKIREATYEYNAAYRWEITLYQPDESVFNYLLRYLRHAPINVIFGYAEVTFDFIVETAECAAELANIIDYTLVHLRRHEKDKKGNFQGEYFYFHPDDNYARYWGSRNDNHNFYPVSYHDRPSKLTGEPCHHLEYRIESKSKCRQHRLLVPSDLLSFNFSRFFKDNTKFYTSPTKYELGLAFAQSENKTFKSRRGYEIYCDSELDALNLTTDAPVQQLLTKVPKLKAIFHTKANQKINQNFTQQMQASLLKNIQLRNAA